MAQARYGVKYNRFMTLIALRRFFGVCFLVISALMIYWGMRPSPQSTKTVNLSERELELDEIPELTGDHAGVLLVEWPEAVRLDDPAQIRLTFSPFPDSQRTTPSKDIQNLQPEPVDGYFRVLLAQLEQAAIRHTPSGEISQALMQNHNVEFLWHLRPDKVGRFDGKIWLHLRFVPESGGVEKRKLLVLIPLEIEVGKLFFLNGPQARLIGLFVGIVGVFIGFEDEISKGLKLIFSRMKR